MYLLTPGRRVILNRLSKLLDRRCGRRRAGGQYCDEGRGVWWLSRYCSMTSVPKPLKFLRAHFTALAAAYETMSDSGVRKELADVLAVGRD